MSTPTDLLPGESEFERAAEGPLSAADEATISELDAILAAEPLTGAALPQRSTRPRKRFRLSRKWRLARTALFLVVLEVILSSVGALPGRGWPLSLLGGHGAGGTRTSAAALGPRDAQADRHVSPARGVTTHPALWASAQAKGLTVYVPTHRLLGIGYHEAATPDGLPLTPIGRCVANDNKGRIRSPRASPGPDYVIMQTRHRSEGPTTAADIAMPKNATVVAPISGRVVQITLYRLYKYWLDYRVVIRPQKGSRLRVVMIHLTDLRVRKGQRVVAGVTPIGHPRVFPFKSDINDYVGRGVPHVHLEVKEIVPPRRSA